MATAKAFAEAGAAVTLADIDEDRGSGRSEELVAAGHKAIGVRCDVTEMDEVAAMVKQTVATFGRLDAAFNNAGVQSPVADTADARSEDYDFVMGVNLRGVWNCMKYELLQMREQRSGAIVNYSSLGGLVGIAERGIYHASKHGVVGLTKSAGLEYASAGNPDQCGVPRHHRNADGYAHAGNPTRSHGGTDERAADRAAGSSGRNCRRRSLAVQPCLQFCDRPRTPGGWWVYGALTLRASPVCLQSREPSMCDPSDESGQVHHHAVWTGVKL